MVLFYSLLGPSEGLSVGPPDYWFYPKESESPSEVKASQESREPRVDYYQAKFHYSLTAYGRPVVAVKVHTGILSYYGGRLHQEKLEAVLDLDLKKANHAFVGKGEYRFSYEIPWIETKGIKVQYTAFFDSEPFSVTDEHVLKPFEPFTLPNLFFYTGYTLPKSKDFFRVRASKIRKSEVVLYNFRRFNAYADWPESLKLSERVINEGKSVGFPKKKANQGRSKKLSGQRNQDLEGILPPSEPYPYTDPPPPYEPPPSIPVT